MKIPRSLSVILVAVIAAAGGWFAARQFTTTTPASGATEGAGARKVLFYQSAMHPWIKSDKPGRCTICGMELSPVFEGDKGIAAGEGLVTLGSNAIQVIHVQGVEVQRRPLRRTLRLAGTIDDNDARHRIVSATVDGRIDSLMVNHLGAEVTAGAPLATLYSPALLAAERDYITLHRAPGAGADRQQLLDGATARLKRLGLNADQIAALPAKKADDIHTTLIAPVTGTVVSRSVYEGQYVKEGEKLFEIADFSTMWFLFDAYERDLAWIKPGQKVEVATPSVPGRTFNGVVTFIDPNMKEMTRSAKVRVELANPLVETNGHARRELYHRLFAEASVQVDVPETLTVPRAAVLAAGPAALVYVDKGEGAYEQRKVRLGRTGDEYYEILEGVSEGERVVTQGSLLIDAQAQLDAGVKDAAAGGTAAPETTSNPLPALTAPQEAAVTEFLKLVDGLTSALASDNLEDFNTRASGLHSALPKLLTAFGDDGPWRALIAKLEPHGHLAPAADLKSARKAFHALNEPAVALAKAARRAVGVLGAVKVFRCPMTKDSFPGAPCTAEWLQLAAPIRNPWFGAEMLDCGSEVKP